MKRLPFSMFFHADRHFYFATFWRTVAKDFKTRVTMKKIYSRGKSMKKHMIPKNSYLSDDTVCYYNRDYIGYQKHGNPDFINRLKNMTGRYDELDLVRDFLKVFDLAYKDIPQIIDEKHLENCAVAIIPRSKAEKTYDPSQLIFKKAISCVADKLNLYNATDAIRRVTDTKTTHSWRLENNSGKMPHRGITKESCNIDSALFRNKDVILVDDIYTEGVYVAEDCMQTLLDFGAKRVILYVIAKTRNRS